MNLFLRSDWSKDRHHETWASGAPLNKKERVGRYLPADSITRQKLWNPTCYLPMVSNHGWVALVARMRAFYSTQKNLRTFILGTPEGWQIAMYDLDRREWIDKNGWREDTLKQAKVTAEAKTAS